MAVKRLLFISGSLGLGHITRDMAIAKRLRDAYPEVEIQWLASGTAAKVVIGAGERMVEGASEYADENDDLERASKGRNVNLFSYLMKARHAWDHNARVFSNIVSSMKPDLVIGDETYEILLELRKRPHMKKWPFTMIFDFVGLDAMTINPFERVGVYAYNYMWSADYRKANVADLVLFVGEREDVLDRGFGFMLPNRRAYVEDRHYKFLGFILPFDPADYIDRPAVKKRLGYGEEPLIMCSIGGTSVGGELLQLCGEALPVLRQSVPGARMILVCGPRFDPKTLRLPDGVETRGYVPSLYEHFAASDLAVVQGGGTTTLELTALRRPFVYFPLEGHSEQQIVNARLARHQAGTKMILSQTTPESLAASMLGQLHSEVSYPPIPIGGAETAARLVADLLM